MNAEPHLTIGEYTAKMFKWGKCKKHIWALIPLKHRIVIKIVCKYYCYCQCQILIYPDSVLDHFKATADKFKETLYIKNCF